MNSRVMPFFAVTTLLAAAFFNPCRKKASGDDGALPSPEITEMVMSRPEHSDVAELMGKDDNGDPIVRTYRPDIIEDPRRPFKPDKRREPQNTAGPPGGGDEPLATLKEPKPPILSYEDEGRLGLHDNRHFMADYNSLPNEQRRFSGEA